mmetsp:Transcript_45464/g.110121  ORF Transcript_45464/g.110121 Transcript_45464/m.110121 type:complete len:256 (-) Transcript_45464:174-941(-)
MGHVSSTQHTNQNGSRRSQDTFGSNTSKSRAKCFSTICSKTSSLGVSLGHVTNHHGQSGVDHTKTADQGKGCQGRQVLQQTKWEQDSGGQCQQSWCLGNIEPSSGQKTDRGISQDHTVCQNGRNGLEGNRNRRNPTAGFVDRLSPGFSVRFGVGVGTATTNQGKSIARKTSNGSDEYHGRNHGRRSIGPSSDTNRQAQDTRPDNALDQVENEFSDSGGSLGNLFFGNFVDGSSHERWRDQALVANNLGGHHHGRW